MAILTQWQSTQSGNQLKAAENAPMRMGYFKNTTKPCLAVCGQGTAFCMFHWFVLSSILPNTLLNSLDIQTFCRPSEILHVVCYNHY